MTHNHSLFRSLCTQRWTRACSLSPEAPSFWLAFQARPALCMHVFVKVQCSSLGSTLEDKCFSVFSTDWRWQWWRTSNSAVAAFIAKRPRVAYSCSYVLLIIIIQTLLCALFYFCARALNFVLTIAHHSVSKNVSSSHHTQLVGGGVAPLRLAGGKSLLFWNAYSSLPGNNHCPLRGDIYGSLPGNICQCPAWARLQSLPGRFSSSLPGNASFFFSWLCFGTPLNSCKWVSLPGSRKMSLWNS